MLLIPDAANKKVIYQSTMLSCIYHKFFINNVLLDN